MLMLPTMVPVELMLNAASPSVWDARSESFLPHAHALPVRVRAEGAKGASHLNTSQEVTQRGKGRVNKNRARDRQRNTNSAKGQGFIHLRI